VKKQSKEPATDASEYLEKLDYDGNPVEEEEAYIGGHRVWEEKGPKDDSYKKVYTTPEEDPLGAPYIPVGDYKYEYICEFKCTCGADTAGVGTHSDWCDKT